MIAERILAIPRLRQKLIKLSPGYGCAIWVDDTDFDVDHHVLTMPCQGPGDERALLDTALSVIMEPLLKQSPLWSIVLITGLSDGAAAIVVVSHHVLADGLGGLNILATLVDPGAPPAAVASPRPKPTLSRLARDTWLTRLNGIRRAYGSFELLRRAMFAGGGFRPTPAAPCSLVDQTGPRRRLAIIRLDRARLAAAAHRYSATTNDAVLVAVGARSIRSCAGIGESVDPIAITVPVSGRRARGGPAVGNLVSPMLVEVPTSGDLAARLARVEAAVRAHKEAATGPPPIAPLGGLFRLIARLGGYRFYMNHQHRFHTLVTHVRGPVEPVTLSGHRVNTAIPVRLPRVGTQLSISRSSRTPAYSPSL